MVMKFESLIKPKTNLLSLHSLASDFRQVKEPLQVGAMPLTEQGLAHKVYVKRSGHSA